jgi:hypothetical protein
MPEAGTKNTAPRMKGLFTHISNSHREEAEEESAGLANLVKQIVPVYAQCLIEVAFFYVEGKAEVL